MTEEKKNKSIKFGFVVGVDESDGFVFNVIGQNVDIMQLIGLGKLAEDRIIGMKNDNFITGDRLTHEVGKAVALLNDKIDKLMKELQPVKQND